MNYVSKIDALITEHEKAIAALTVARGVIMQLEGIKPPRPAGELPAPKSPPPKKVRVMRKKVAPEMRSQILAIMSDASPNSLSSKEIFNQLPNGYTVKSMWNVVYNMKEAGMLQRLADGRYAMPDVVPLELGPRDQ